MKRPIALLAFLLPVLFSNVFAQTLEPLTPKLKFYEIPEHLTDADYIPGRLYVKVKDKYRANCTDDNIDIPFVKEILQTMGTHQIDRLFKYSPVPDRKYNEIGQELVDVSLMFEVYFDKSIYGVEDAVNLLLATGAFEYAEPHYVYELFFTPNDYDTLQYAIDELQCHDAWNITKGDSNVVIGIIDTGTSLIHPDLINKHVYNMNDTIDGADNDGDGYIDNYYGWDFEGDCALCGPDNNPTYSGPDHGVVVTGCAAMETDNGQCLAGVGFDTRFTALKVTQNGGNTIMRGYEAIVYGADHDINILNLAWGGSVYTRFGEDICNYAVVNRGVVLVAAGGNTPIDIRIYPAAYHNVIGVAGTQQGGGIWFNHSQFGSTFNYLLDVAAPSKNVGTTAQHGICSPAPSWATGTSLGAPLVSGVVALVKAQYPSLNNIQCGQVARVTAWDSIYVINPSKNERMGKGRVNAYNAVTYNSPSVRIATMKMVDDDGDGYIESGDTIEVRAKFVNWLNPTDDLTITMTTPNGSDINILDGSLTFGPIGTLDTVSAHFAAFKIVITTSGASQDKLAYLRFDYDDGTYKDWEYWPVTINQSVVRFNDHDNVIQTSTNSTGDIATQQGFFFDSEVNYMGEGGFMIGTSSTKVSDNFRNNQSGTQDADFQTVTFIDKMMPGAVSDVYAFSEFNDNNAGVNKIGVTVEQHVYSNTVPEDSGYIIFEYIIKNTSGSPINGAYAGIFHDWDVGWWQNNFGQYDTTEKMLWVYDPALFSWDYLGSGLLTNDSVFGFVRDITGTYTTSDKWDWLRTLPDTAASAIADIFTTLSTGPLNIGTGGQDTIAFYMVGGKTFNEMSMNAQRARNQYNCVIRGNMVKPNLGAEIIHCGAPTPYVLDAGAGYASYVWNTGDTTQTIAPDSTGHYIVRVTDGSGCETHAQIDITVEDVISGGFTASATNLILGDTVWFVDTAANTTGHAWDFGDGTPRVVGDSVWHVFGAYGTYNVSLIQTDDCICSDTTTMSIQVDTLLGVIGPVSGKQTLVNVYPNPASGSLNVVIGDLSSGAIDLEISDILGASVLKLRQAHPGGEFRQEIKVEHLPGGIYFLSAATAEGRVATRFVKN